MRAALPADCCTIDIDDLKLNEMVSGVSGGESGQGGCRGRRVGGDH